MSHMYYKEKLNRLVVSLFHNTKDARNKFIENEKRIKTVVLASHFENQEIINKWKKVWNDLTKKEALLLDDKEVIETSFHQTIISKKNKSLENYLTIIWEEYSRIN